MKELLLNLRVCEDARDWADGKSWKEIYETCHRGDWLLWLFSKVKSDSEEDFSLLTIAKGHCANTVRHLMKDERSIRSVDAAINYKGNRIELKNADAAAYADARIKNRQETADIVRKFIPIEKWNIDINLTW